MEHDFIVITSKKVIGVSAEIKARLLHAHFAQLLHNPQALTSFKSKLAQSMAAPIKRNLDYQGIARRVLNVDPLPQGALPIYDKDIDVAKCVVDQLEGYDHDDIIITSRGKIGQRDKVSGPFARRVTVPTFEVFSNPTVRISDVKRRRFSILDRSIQKARAEIMAQEDEDIFAALDAAADVVKEQ